MTRFLTRTVGGGFVGLLVLLPATSASAHSELVESTPAVGASLTKPPTQVELVFAESVQQAGGSIMVSLGGMVLSDPSTFTASDNVASVQLPDATQPGTYRVTFRVVSADGHPVRDSFEYVLKGTGKGSLYTDAADPRTTPLAEESGDGSDDGGGAVVWVLGAGAIGIALVAALIAVAVRGRRDRSY